MINLFKQITISFLSGNQRVCLLIESKIKIVKELLIYQKIIFINNLLINQKIGILQIDQISQKYLMKKKANKDIHQQ